MRNRAAQHGGMQQPGQVHVVHERGAPRQQGSILAPLQSRTDMTGFHVHSHADFTPRTPPRPTPRRNPPGTHTLLPAGACAAPSPPCAGTPLSAVGTPSPRQDRAVFKRRP